MLYLQSGPVDDELVYIWTRCVDADRIDVVRVGQPDHDFVVWQIGLRHRFVGVEEHVQRDVILDVVVVERLLARLVVLFQRRRHVDAPVSREIDRRQLRQ